MTKFAGPGMEGPLVEFLQARFKERPLDMVVPVGAPAGPPLNILLITLDTTRADHLGCYGWRRARTPAITRVRQARNPGGIVRDGSDHAPSHRVE